MKGHPDASYITKRPDNQVSKGPSSLTLRSAHGRQDSNSLNTSSSGRKNADQAIKKGYLNVVDQATWCVVAEQGLTTLSNKKGRLPRYRDRGEKGRNMWKKKKSIGERTRGSRALIF